MSFNKVNGVALKSSFKLKYKQKNAKKSIRTSNVVESCSMKPIN